MAQTDDISETGSQPGGVDTPPRRGLGYAWYAVLVLTVCYTLSFIDRQILSLLIGPIKADLGVSDTQIGLLGGFAFSLFYTFLGLPLGRLVDRYNRRNIIAAGVVLWSAMTALCAVTRTFGGLFLARMGVGVGEAALSPAAISMIADSFPKDRLASALSTYAMGIYIGSGLALLVGGLVVQAMTAIPTINLPLFGSIASWRGTFLIVGLPGIVVALWVLTLCEPPRGQAIAAADGGRSALTIAQTLAEIRQRWRSLAGIGGGLMMMAVALYAYLLWAPTVLQRSYGWSPPETGVTMGLVVLIGGCLGMFAGGRLSDAMLRKGRRDAALCTAAASAAGSAIVFLLLLATMGSAPATVFFFFIGAILISMPTGSSYAASQMILPNQVRGQAIALLLFVGNLGGLTMGPLLPGLLNDYVFFDEAALGKSLALTMIGATAGAALLFAWARPAYRIDHERLNSWAEVDEPWR